MIKSLNKKVDVTLDATAFIGIAQYGKIMVGDGGFEFYNARDTGKYLQIPWEEVEMVVASVFFKGKWIPRYAIKTKSCGNFNFASKAPKTVLRTMRKYVEGHQMVQSLGFFDVVKRAFKKSEEAMDS